jgi:uncharacterized protein YkwD
MTRSPSLEAALVAEVNAVRTRHGVRAVRVSPDLRQAAASHSATMGRLGYFGHRSPDGAPFWRRILRWYPVGQYSYWHVGENLLWQSGAITSDRALRRWLQSPEHRAVVLAGRWREVGIAVVRVRDAPGSYAGRDVTIVTADFGVRVP